MDKDLSGTWQLTAVDLRSAEGTSSHPFGRDVQGYLTYNPNGCMSVSIVKRNGPYHIAQEQTAEDFFSYSGTYEVRGETVTHHVNVSYLPNWSGLDQECAYRLHGDQLTLSMQVPGFGKITHLIWERTRMRDHSDDLPLLSGYFLRFLDL